MSLFSPLAHQRRPASNLSSIPKLEATKKLKKIVNLLSWSGTVKLFNSLKIADIKFTRKQPKTLIEAADFLNPEPLYFVMPPIIRKEFEAFNATENRQQPSISPNAMNVSLDDSKISHKFLPEENFMRQVIEFRKNAQVAKTENHSQSKVVSKMMRAFKSLLTRKDKPVIKQRERESPVVLGKKVSLLGFHGWFPNKLLQRVIGDPRRTSARMVEMLEAAVSEADPFPPYFEGPPAIYKFPLQCEGTIEERVEKHFAELQGISDNYSQEGLTSLEHLKESDTIVFGAHSQGAPVAIILLAKLLDLGLIDPEKQNVTVLTVAGIFHGPFPPLRKNLVVQYVEDDAARQLFDLNNPNSSVSKLLQRSLDKILQSGINLSCVASWLDQVVPFYSACLLGFDHPNIWRSVHIPADHFRPDFMTKLVEIGLKIKNTLPGLGEPDTHMILAELSEYISGSIYQHATHSSAYRKMDSYKAALDWMKMGPASRDIPIKPVDHIRNRPLQSTVNPYFLPWLFRGWLKRSDILENPLLGDEMRELRSLFEHWKPESKVLKDFKFKLEPMAMLSKL